MLRRLEFPHSHSQSETTTNLTSYMLLYFLQKKYVCVCVCMYIHRDDSYKDHVILLKFSQNFVYMGGCNGFFSANEKHWEIKSHKKRCILGAHLFDFKITKS
jgi:hypothetical protein